MISYLVVVDIDRKCACVMCKGWFTNNFKVVIDILRLEAELTIGTL